jgi:hypothetical protein
MDADERRAGWPAWQRGAQALGAVLLLVAHATALAVGGYAEWPTWAVVVNFAGLVLFIVPLVVRLATRS